MNFLCHARNQHDPWFVVGALLPDFLSFFREARLRPAKMAAASNDENASQNALRQGAALHFFEDGWFHSTPAFLGVTHQLTQELRSVSVGLSSEKEVLEPKERAFRAHFFAHILLEMLLDAAWEQENKGATAELYSLLASLKTDEVEKEVHLFLQASGVEFKPPIAFFLERFISSKFLFDYDDDEKVLYRLNQVGQRVRQPPMGIEFLPVFSAGRSWVWNARGALWTAPS